MRDTTEAPPLQPTRFGLVAAAAAIDGTERWTQGVTFGPEGCGRGGALPYDCVVGEGELVGDPDPADAIGFDAFEIYAVDRCTALNNPDVASRAARALAATRSFQIERELWQGTITQERHADDAGDEPEGPSPYLLDGDADTVTAGVGMIGLAKVDAEFAACSQGRRAMLHLTPYALAIAMDRGSEYIYRDGNMLLTQLGSIVVAGAGYGASATDLHVHATPLVGLRLDQVRTTPSDNSPEQLAAALDRSDNKMTGLAQQVVLYQFDADCCRKVGSITTS